MKTFREFQIEQVVEKWRTTGLLNGLNEQAQASCACALQSQLKINEGLQDCKVSSGDWAKAENNLHLSQFKRVSIPIIRRIFGSIEINGNETNECQWYNTGFEVKKYLFEQNSTTFSLQAEADMTAQLALDLAKYLINENYSHFSGLKVQNGNFYILAS